jgi:hypothetical protein
VEEMILYNCGTLAVVCISQCGLKEASSLMTPRHDTLWDESITAISRSKPQMVKLSHLLVLARKEEHV